MRTLAIEMPGGVAGDMLLAALLDCGADQSYIQCYLNGLGVGPLPLEVARVAVGPLHALRLTVAVPQEAGWDQGGHVHGDHSHHGHSHDDHGHGKDHHHGVHRPYGVIRELLCSADLPPRVRQRSLAVFHTLACAEAAVHGVTVDEVVFHEVGGLDAIADVVGVCLALENLGIERVCSGPLLLGQGHVHCAHGRMPVPVPAVQHMLTTREVPTQRINFQSGELTTPTGCALVLGLADDFVLADGIIRATGQGAGHKTIPGLSNLVRVSVIETIEADRVERLATDSVVELRAVIDDSTPELLALAADQLREAGARDVWIHGISMKKGRQGWELVVIADPDRAEALAEQIFIHTPTIGLRRSLQERLVLPRHEVQVVVFEHAIRCKVVRLPHGSKRVKAEAGDVQRVARQTGQPPWLVKQQAEITAAQLGPENP